MQKIKNPIGRLIIHITLWVFILYNSVPFFWTFLQSLKTKKQANSRTPLFWFEPTLEHYSDLKWVQTRIEVYGNLPVFLFSATAEMSKKRGHYYRV